jgi:hypothetical protein
MEVGKWMIENSFTISLGHLFCQTLELSQLDGHLSQSQQVLKPVV